MRNKSIFTIWIVGILTISIMGFLLSTDIMTREAQGTPPVLSEASAWPYESFISFSVIYEDFDNDTGTVILTVDGNPYEMETDFDNSPVDGQYFHVDVPASTITDDSEFFYYAEDINGESAELGSEQYPFYIGDYTGWGEPPILSNPSVYQDGDWVFNVTYQDPIDGDEAYAVRLIIIGESEDNYIQMETEDLDPIAGQNYIARVPENGANQYTEFYFDADDVEGSYTELYEGEWDYFVVGKLLQSNGGNGDENGNGGGGGTGIQLSEGWAEVLVGLIALGVLAGGSAYGIYRRKKKHGRFSELLTQLDEVYASYKLNPKRCETELEKIKGTINEDLKKSTIDDNNYSILKGRIDEILSEIRSESLRTEVVELPKDIEIKIKDMLIDGEITRAEYDKILPIIKGSAMTSDDKEKVKKMVESYMVEEKE